MKQVHVSKVLWDETMSGTILVMGTCEQTTRPNATDRTASCGFDKYKEPRLKGVTGGGIHASAAEQPGFKAAEIVHVDTRRGMRDKYNDCGDR